MAVQSRADQQNFPFILSGEVFSRTVTFLQDAGRAAALVFGTVMAKVMTTIPTTGTADAGNTGDGTVTAVSAGAGGFPIIGEYVLENTLAVADGGVFKLTDPNGNIVATQLTMTVGAGLATVFVAGGLTFTITDGATNFALADSFIIDVTANGKWVPFDPTAVDGSQIPSGIFVGDDIAAASLVAGDVTDQAVYVGGCATFDTQQIVFDDGTSTLATVLENGQTVQDALDSIGLFSELTVDIDELEN